MAKKAEVCQVSEGVNMPITIHKKNQIKNPLKRRRLMMNIKQTEAKKYLKTIIKPSSTLVISIKNVSRSGMSRQMTVGVIRNNQLYNITYYVNDLLGYSNRKNYVLVRGCGMDMTFWLADAITHLLFNNNKYKTFKGNGGSCLNWQVI